MEVGSVTDTLEDKQQSVRRRQEWRRERARTLPSGPLDAKSKDVNPTGAQTHSQPQRGPALQTLQRHGQPSACLKRSAATSAFLSVRSSSNASPMAKSTSSCSKTFAASTSLSYNPPAIPSTRT